MLLSTLIGFVTAYIFTVYIAWHLTQEEYAYYGIILSVLSIASCVLTSGIPVALSKFISRSSSVSLTLLKSSIKYEMLLFLLFIPSFFVHPLLPAVILLIALSSPFQGVLYGTKRFKEVFVANTASSILKLLGILLVVLGLGVDGAVAGFLIASLSSFLLFFIFSRRENMCEKREDTGSFLRFALVSGITVILFSTLHNIPLLLLSFLSFQMSYIALFQASITVARIPLWISSAYTTAVFPYIVKERNLAESAVKYLLIFTTFLTLALVSFPELTLSLLFPSSYLKARDMLVALSVAMGFVSLSYLLAFILKAEDKEGYAVRCVVTGTALLILLSVLAKDVVLSFVLSSAAMLVLLLARTLSYFKGFYTSYLLSLLPSLVLLFFLKELSLFSFLLSLLLTKCVTLAEARTILEKVLRK
jgi:O-antigen/teichoic acid export membrane protein